MLERRDDAALDARPGGRVLQSEADQGERGAGRDGVARAAHGDHRDRNIGDGLLQPTKRQVFAASDLRAGMLDAFAQFVFARSGPIRGYGLEASVGIDFDPSPGERASRRRAVCGRDEQVGGEQRRRAVAVERYDVGPSAGLNGRTAQKAPLLAGNVRRRSVARRARDADVRGRSRAQAQSARTCDRASRAKDQ